jgi:maleate isomerase
MAFPSPLGSLSGKPVARPDVNTPPMPSLASPGVLRDGEKAVAFGGIDGSRGYPDVLSFKLKLGLILPATNTSLEHDLWSLLIRNWPVLRGIGLHTTPVVTPRPRLRTEADLLDYRRQFLDGLKAAVDVARLARPQYFIMGMSLEHVIAGLDGVRAEMADIEAYSGLSWSAWHDAVHAALSRMGARRIGVLTPFDRKGNENARALFEDLGYEVVSTVGFACDHPLHIAHVPDWAKEKAILEELATPGNRLDAVVQCGTNMSLLDVAERLEPVVGVPILGINATLLWHALRENGVQSSLSGGGRLLREA